jgi:myosin heavy subunit
VLGMDLAWLTRSLVERTIQAGNKDHMTPTHTGGSGGIVRSLCQCLYSETFYHVVACLNKTLGAVKEEKRDL